MNSKIIAFTLGLSILGAASLRAQSIAIPNFSFEGPVATFGIDPNTDSWQEIPKPNFFTDTPELSWSQTSGVFLDTNPYLNRDGLQAGYMLSIPQVTLFQDLADATYQPGNSYTFTLGVFGKSMMEGSLLNLSLFYRDGEMNKVFIGAPTTVVFSTNTFVNSGSLSFIDQSVSIATVQESDAWAGKNIGIQIESVAGNGNGYWDIDNARLVAVPEPGTWALMALGFGGLFAAKRRFHRK